MDIFRDQDFFQANVYLQIVYCSLNGFKCIFTNIFVVLRLELGLAQALAVPKSLIYRFCYALLHFWLNFIGCLELPLLCDWFKCLSI